MRVWILFYVVAQLGASFVNSASAQTELLVMRTAALSEYVSRVEVLDGMVRDLSMTAAVALLSQSYTDWNFEHDSGFGSYQSGVYPPISNELGKIASEVENAFIYIKGKYVKNDAVPDAQRQQAQEVIEDILRLVKVCRELEALLSEGAQQQAGTIFRDDIVPDANELTQKIQSLTNELNQQIKFSAL